MIAFLNFSSATEVIATAEKYKGTKMNPIKFHKIMKRMIQRTELHKQHLDIRRINAVFLNLNEQMIKDIAKQKIRVLFFCVLQH